MWCLSYYIQEYNYVYLSSWLIAFKNTICHLQKTNKAHTFLVNNQFVLCNSSKSVLTSNDLNDSLQSTQLISV